MSEGLRAEFTALAERIKEVKSEDEFPSIKETYDVLKKKLVAENRKMGKNVVYTKELKEFIYWSVYHLLDVPAKKKEGQLRRQKTISQATIGEVFGISDNKFERYDLYPMRSYKAFNKHEYISMIPNKTDTLGICIAKVLNRGVLAPHACRKTILVTNDLDVFANIESPDNKKYIMTIPSIESLIEINDIDTKVERVRQINYAYARFLFANGNNLYDAAKKRASAGEIKKCIKELLEMKDVLAEEDIILDSALKNEEISLSKYFDKNYDNRAKYIEVIKAIKYYDKLLEEDDNVIFEALYDDPYEEYIRGNEGIIAERDVRKNISMRKEVLEKKSKQLHKQLILDMDIKGYLNSQAMSLSDYINAWTKDIKSNLLLGFGECGLELKAELCINKMVRTAAIYWLSMIGVTSENIGELIEWLGTGALLRYFDAINQEANNNEKKGEKKERNRVHEHIKYSMGTIEWKDILSTSKNSRPVLIYIDKNHYDVGVSELAYLVSRGDCIIVIHGEEAGFDILDSDLQLYYKGGR